jgi:hypothetical protein
MAKVLQFPSGTLQTKNLGNDPFALYNDYVGADLYKVGKGDREEIKKLQRNLLKETIKVRTQLI